MRLFALVLISALTACAQPRPDPISQTADKMLKACDRYGDIENPQTLIRRARCRAIAAKFLTDAGHPHGFVFTAETSAEMEIARMYESGSISLAKAQSEIEDNRKMFASNRRAINEQNQSNASRSAAMNAMKVFADLAKQNEQNAYRMIETNKYRAGVVSSFSANATALTNQGNQNLNSFMNWSQNMRNSNRKACTGLICP